MARILSLIVLFVLVVVAFFIYTAKKAEPQALKLFLPKDDEVPAAPNRVKDSACLTVILAENNRIYYYRGNFNVNTVEKTDYNGIRSILAERKKELGEEFVVLIKPHEKATYTNTVNMLDEMAIGDIKRYALVDITSEESDYLKTKE